MPAPLAVAPLLIGYAGRTLGLVRRLVDVVLIAHLAIMVAVVLAQVLARYAFNRSVPGAACTSAANGAPPSKAGDVLVSDNRCSLHRASEWDETRHRRRLHRIILLDDARPV